MVERNKFPGLWKKLGLKGSPSLLIRDTKTGKKIMLQGLSEESRLDAARKAIGTNSHVSHSHPNVSGSGGAKTTRTRKE